MTNQTALNKLLWVTVALASVLLIACGGDDDDTNGQGSTPPANNGSSNNQPTTSGGGGGGGDRGSATLTIGDETWEFDAFGCAFGHEATRSDLFSFSSDARGEHSTGARVQMQANITDDTGQGRYEGDGVGYEVFLSDIDDFANPDVKWFASNEAGLFGSSGELVITIDGDNLTAVGTFDDELTEGEVEAIPGTLTARCGSQSIR